MCILIYNYYTACDRTLLYLIMVYNIEKKKQINKKKKH